MKVYIGFSEPTAKFAPFAWLIKKIEARPYDHCYVRFQEPNGDWMIFQASKEMVNMYGTAMWLQFNKPHKEYEVECSPEQCAALWVFIKKNLGLPYSLKEDFGILLMKILHISKNLFGDAFASFCSELAAQACEVLGLAMPDDVDTIDPTKLDSILSALKLPCNENPVF